jgi:hypothetical protein
MGGGLASRLEILEVSSFLVQPKVPSDGTLGCTRKRGTPRISIGTPSNPPNQKQSEPCNNHLSYDVNLFFMRFLLTDVQFSTLLAIYISLQHFKWTLHHISCRA